MDRMSYRTKLSERPSKNRRTTLTWEAMDKDGNQPVLEREREFHNKRYSSDAGHRSEERFYRALHDLFTAFDQIVQVASQNADVLDYGCGTGERVFEIEEKYHP